MREEGREKNRNMKEQAAGSVLVFNLDPWYSNIGYFYLFLVTYGSDESTLFTYVRNSLTQSWMRSISFILAQQTKCDFQS